MSKRFICAGIGALSLCALALAVAPRASAQDPILTPVIVDTAAPIIVRAITPKPKEGVVKFQGYIVNANVAQLTARARENDLAVQTFPLSQAAAAKMQKIIDKGGYQHGDKITVYYDSKTRQALKFKGKPSRPL